MLFEKCAEICLEDKVTIECGSPGSFQPILLHDADEVIDLADDSETIVIQQPAFVPYNNNNIELQFPTSLFVNIAPEWLEDLPQDIDGIKVFTKRMGSEKPGLEVLQDAFFKKEGPIRNKEGRKVHWKSVLPL